MLLLRSSSETGPCLKAEVWRSALQAHAAASDSKPSFKSSPKGEGIFFFYSASSVLLLEPQFLATIVIISSIINALRLRIATAKVTNTKLGYTHLKVCKGVLSV